MLVIKICFSLELRLTVKWPSLSCSFFPPRTSPINLSEVLLKRLLASESGGGRGPFERLCPDHPGERVCLESSEGRGVQGSVSVCAVRSGCEFPRV